MTRILLVLVIIAATGAVLWSSWRLDRRLFGAVLVVSTILLVLFVGGYFESREETFVPIAVDKVTLELLRWRATESGVRLEGRIHNDSDKSVALVSGDAVLLDCPDPDSCEEQARTPLELRQHVPPGVTYPFNTILRVDVALPPHAHWRLDVKRVQGYTPRHRLGG